MLIVYNISSQSVISVSGARPNGRTLSDAEKTVTLSEPLPPGQGEYHVTDETTMDAVWVALDAGAKVEIVSNNQGNPVDVKAYAPISATVSPNPATVNATVTVTATLPADTPDTTVTFQGEGGAAYVEPVTGGQASHAYAFTLPGTYQVIVSSAHHGQTVVEVVIQ